MNELMIIFIVVFIVIATLVVISGICFIKQGKKKNRNLRALFLSYDKPKQVRISMLKNDLINSNELISEFEALELAIELEKKGWRKEIKIDDIEAYLWKKKSL